MRYKRPMRKSEKSLRLLGPDLRQQAERVGLCERRRGVTDPSAQGMDLDAHEVQSGGTRV